MIMPVGIIHDMETADRVQTAFGALAGLGAVAATGNPAAFGYAYAGTTAGLRAIDRMARPKGKKPIQNYETTKNTSVEQWRAYRYKVYDEWSEVSW